jgi:alpha-beta hydrolase superfamily lysophospholipase
MTTGGMQNSATVAVDTESIRQVTCGDGYNLRYRVWAEDDPVATIVLLNGLISHSGWFSELGNVLAKRRLKVVGADRRGSGLNQRGRGDAPSRRVLLSDLQTIIDKEAPGESVWIAGWCWGAVLAVNAALEFGDLVRGLALFAPGLFPSNEIRIAARRALDEEVPDDPQVPHLPSPIADEMFSTDQNILCRIANDQLVQRRFTSRLFAVSREMSLIAAVRLQQLRCPVLLVLAAEDRAVDNERTTQACRRIRTDLKIENIECNHAIQFEAPQRLADELSSWIEGAANRFARETI